MHQCLSSGCLLNGILCSLQVVINEVQPVNDNTITNSQGKTPSWVELYNPTPSSVFLQVGQAATVHGLLHSVLHRAAVCLRPNSIAYSTLAYALTCLPAYLPS